VMLGTCCSLYVYGLTGGNGLQ